MADVAELEIRISSVEAVQAERRLDALEDSAARADRQTQQLGRTFEVLTAELQGITGSLATLVSSLAGVGTAGAAAGAGLGSLGAQAAAAFAQIDQLAAAAGPAALARLDAEATQAFASLNQLGLAAGNLAGRRLEVLNNAVQRTEVSLRRAREASLQASSAFGTMVRSAFPLLSIFGAIAAFRGFIRLSDDTIVLQNRLRTVTRDAEELRRVQARLADVAVETRADFRTTAEIFARVGLAAENLGRTQEELIQFTRSLNQAVALSGATAQEANAGLIQLAQGLASNRLQGEELRAVFEQLPVVARLIAESLGVTTGELRELAAEGEITAEVVLDAFADARQELDDRFGEVIPTLAQAFTNLGTRVREFVAGDGNLLIEFLRVAAIRAERTVDGLNNLLSGEVSPDVDTSDGVTELQRLRGALILTTLQIDAIEQRLIGDPDNDALRARLANLRVELMRNQEALGIFEQGLEDAAEAARDFDVRVLERELELTRLGVEDAGELAEAQIRIADARRDGNDALADTLEQRQRLRESIQEELDERDRLEEFYEAEADLLADIRDVQLALTEARDGHNAALALESRFFEDQVRLRQLNNELTAEEAERLLELRAELEETNAQLERAAELRAVAEDIGRAFGDSVRDLIRQAGEGSIELERIFADLGLRISEIFVEAFAIQPLEEGVTEFANRLLQDEEGNQAAADRLRAASVALGTAGGVLNGAAERIQSSANSLVAAALALRFASSFGGGEGGNGSSVVGNVVTGAQAFLRGAFVAAHGLVVDEGGLRGQIGLSGVLRAQRGAAILDQPTSLVSAGGRRVAAAEAGRPEAILPLERTREGDLGVRVAGGMGGTQQVVNNRSVTVNAVIQAPDPNAFRPGLNQAVADARRVARI